MVSIEVYDKIKLKSGEIARIVEIYKDGVAYEAEIFRQNGEFTRAIDMVRREDIASVFKEVEHPLSAN